MLCCHEALCVINDQSWKDSHPEDFADMLIVVGEGKEDGKHEEVAADDDVRFVTLCNSSQWSLVMTGDDYERPKQQD